MNFNTFGQELETIIDYFKSNSYSVIINIDKAYSTRNCPLISQSTRFYVSNSDNKLNNIDEQCSYNPAGIAIFVSKAFTANNIKAFRDYVAYEMLRRKTTNREDIKEKWSVSASVGINIFKTENANEIKWQKVQNNYNSASHNALNLSEPETTDISELIYYIQSVIEKNIKKNLEKLLYDFKGRDYPRRIKQLQDKNDKSSKELRQRERITELLEQGFVKNFDTCRDISDYWLDEVIACNAIDEVFATIGEFEDDGRNVEDWDPDTAHDYIWSFTEWLDKEYSGLIYKFVDEEIPEDKLPLTLEYMQEWYYDIGDHSLPDEDDYPYPDDDY